jgi:hypothetical protein
MEMRHFNARLSIYGMGDELTFMIKEYTPLATRVCFTCIIEDAQ